MPLVEKTYTASQTHVNYSSVDEFSIFGGEFDTFGAPLTPAILKDPNTIIAFDANLGDNITIKVDQVTIEVFYQIPAAQPLELSALPWANESLQAGCVNAGSAGPVFCVVGRNGLAKTSTDLGETWEDKNTGIVNHLRAVTIDVDNAFIAAGDNARIISSTDYGETWDNTPVLNGVSSDHILDVNFNRENGKVNISNVKGSIFGLENRALVQTLIRG